MENVKNVVPKWKQKSFLDQFVIMAGVIAIILVLCILLNMYGALSVFGLVVSRNDYSEGSSEITEFESIAGEHSGIRSLGYVVFKDGDDIHEARYYGSKVTIQGNSMAEIKAKAKAESEEYIQSLAIESILTNHRYVRDYPDTIAAIEKLKTYDASGNRLKDEDGNEISRSLTLAILNEAGLFNSDGELINVATATPVDSDSDGIVDTTTYESTGIRYDASRYSIRIRARYQKAVLIGRLAGKYNVWNIFDISEWDWPWLSITFNSVFTLAIFLGMAGLVIYYLRDYIEIVKEVKKIIDNVKKSSQSNIKDALKDTALRSLFIKTGDGIAESKKGASIKETVEADPNKRRPGRPKKNAVEVPIVAETKVEETDEVDSNTKYENELTEMLNKAFDNKNDKAEEKEESMINNIVINTETNEVIDLEVNEPKIEEESDVEVIHKEVDDMTEEELDKMLAGEAVQGEVAPVEEKSATEKKSLFGFGKKLD